MDFNLLLDSINSLINQKELTTNECLNKICSFLQSKISYYDWVGFYFSKEETQTLHLKAFTGEPTEHTVIPFNKGICGQVAVSNNPFLVEDVTSQDNYISCSLDVKSELVVPLFVKNKNIGQIDIDSKKRGAFSQDDIDFLTQVNHMISNKLLLPIYS